jgi:5'-3' exonuclease/transcription antitermination factor NusG
MAEWVVLELGPLAEGEDPAIVRSAIRSTIRDAEVFIPASVIQVGEDRVVKYLVDGYAFVRRDHEDSRYLRLEDTRYVQTVVRNYGVRGRRLAVVTDRDIDKFRRQVRAHSDQGIDVGDTVVINSGPYRNLQAVVVEDIPENDSVQVSVELRSKDSLITLPRSFLHLVAKATLPPYVLKVREARAWFGAALPALMWSLTGFDAIRQKHAEIDRLDRWLMQGRRAQAEIRLESSPDLLRDMRRSQTRYITLTRWLDRGTHLYGFVRAMSLPFDLSPVETVATEWARLDGWLGLMNAAETVISESARDLSFDAVQRLARDLNLLDGARLRLLDIDREVRSIERLMEGASSTENLVIDGLNMVVRCSMAPGLSDLRDARGRPTGAIVGFLNSLSSLRKKHPDAEVWVCWDSPSTWRKALYAEYKANRNPLRMTFEVEWLKAMLPLLGVWQAQAEGEEADDVVASLVRGRLEGQRNLIVSTDRDFLQLVTDTTQVLVPAVGSGKERLCTPESVRAEYGVLPDRMVHLRALGGDTSDNIPGAPGCGNKTASKLLNLYGTVDGIFGSTLAGLSQSLRDKLRSAEAQVRINLRLMALSTDRSLALVLPEASQEGVEACLDDIGMNKSRVFSAFF